MYLFLIARRYLLARWIMSGAAVLAVLLAVFTLVVVRSVFQGFGDQMRSMVRGTTAHLVLTTWRPMNLPYADEITAKILELPHVRGAAPYVETMAMFQTQTVTGPYTDYLQVRGIDPVKEATVGELARYLLREEDLRAAIVDETHALKRPGDRRPLSNEEIAALFGPAHRDRIWQSHKQHYQKYAPEQLTAWEKKLPPPVVVGVQALLGLGRLVSYGSVIQLTTYSPHRGEITTGEFLVVGAFHTGLFETDRRTLYMPLGAACEFAGLYDPDLPDAYDPDLPAEARIPIGGWRVSGIGIVLDDYEFHKDVVAQAITHKVMPPFVTRIAHADGAVRHFRAYTTTWEEKKRTLLRAVEIEKGIVTLIIGILVVFVGAIIFLILTLNVTEKRRDIGILKAVGAYSPGVMSIFLIHGGVICVVGLALGFTGGLTFCHHINAIHDTIHAWTGWQLFPPDVYYMDRIPVAIKMRDLIQITGFTVLFGFLGSLLPAYWAARQDPIAAIHSE